mmetsp:Transcript_26321/g.55896  ORF Transcript_26321/g.55896 Transcript_26321/m.55896 type:complete len:443 (-) Transcript_26321:149-1477(-)
MSGYGSSDINPMLRSMPEDTEEWRQNGASFDGDFYREPDNVTRGVMLAPPRLEVSTRAGSCFEGGFHGDFYHESHDIGVGMDHGQVPELFAESALAGFPGCLGSDPDYLIKFDPFTNAKEQISALPSVLERFEEGDVPPTAPSDELFEFEVTTLYASCEAPHDIGNHLLDFLDTQMVSSVSKVRRKKYAIKADAFVGTVMCTLKVRVYGQERGEYAIEFQRRSGDCLTFNSAYQRAGSYLAERVTVSNAPKAACQVSPAPLSSIVEGGLLEEAEISPLLDMAGLVDLPSLQAESVTVLERLAQDEKAAGRLLCTAHAFEAIKKLLQTDQNDVAYPTARMLTLLSQCDEAVPRFADHELLSTIVGKVRSEAVSALVQQELAAVLNSAITRCAAALIDKSADAVMRDLAEAMKDMEAVSEGLIYQDLQKAHCTLKSKRLGAAKW